jgi:hypothetical protein
MFLKMTSHSGRKRKLDQRALTIDSMLDVLRIFINGQLIGSVIGHWVKVAHPVQFVQGYNDLVLLSETVGLVVYRTLVPSLRKMGQGLEAKSSLLDLGMGI